MKPVTREILMWAIVGARWRLSDRKLRCGPTAIANQLRLEYPAVVIPSLRTIARIITEIDLADARTGRYDK